MANHVAGTSTPNSVLSPNLGELRQHVLAALFGNPLFTATEQLRANHFVHECEDVARLTRWHTNVLTEIARRQAVAARAHGQQATHPPSNRRRERPCTPAWVPSAPLPSCAARRAVCCRPARSLAPTRLPLSYRAR